MVNLSKLVDNRNIDLWNEITSKYEVDVQETINSNYGCYSESKTVIFYVPQNNYCPDSFTHELLHIYIRLKHVYICSNLILRVASSNNLKRIFNARLLEHIGNCLDHIKMLPIYLKMGYRKDKFLFDFHENKCTDQELSEIKRYYKLGKNYNAKAVDVFIGKFFAIKADPNVNFNYSIALIKLKEIDEKLYLILDNFLISWIYYDLDNKDIFNTYSDLVDQFYNELKSWLNNKIIV